LDVLKKPLNYTGENYQIQPLLDEFSSMYTEDDIFQQDGIMSLLLWYYRDEPDIAYNIFTLVGFLIEFIPHVTIELEVINKKCKTDEDDEDLDYESGNKINFRMSTCHLNQLIELLFRVFDYDQVLTDIDTDTISNIQEIIDSDLWSVPLNTTNTELIQCVVRKSANIYYGNNIMIENLIRRTHHVILCAIKLYNLFVDIGNKNLIAVLNPAINAIKSFNDKLKLIDQSHN
jgi:hypothetical protein